MFRVKKMLKEVFALQVEKKKYFKLIRSSESDVTEFASTEVEAPPGSWYLLSCFHNEDTDVFILC